MLATRLGHHGELVIAPLDLIDGISDLLSELLVLVALDSYS